MSTKYIMVDNECLKQGNGKGCWGQIPPILWEIMGDMRVELQISRDMTIWDDSFKCTGEIGVGV